METVFHHNYYYMEDTISINLQLNVHNKSRGAATGPPLINTNLEEWKVTKQSLARLVGQCFQIDGSFLDPVLISLKIVFSTCCRIQESWKQEVTDQDFVDELKAFLTVLKFTYTELKTWPRCLIPQGHSVRSIHCHTDGASFAASHVYFLVTAPVGRPLGSDTQCWQGDAGSRIKRHSVPTNEALGLLQGVESVAAFLYEHADMILKNSPIDGKLVVSFGLDSSCVASSLNPKMVHKQVLIKNLSNKIHETTKDITSLYPSIAIVFYHIKGTLLITTPRFLMIMML